MHIYVNHQSVDNSPDKRDDPHETRIYAMSVLHHTQSRTLTFKENKALMSDGINHILCVLLMYL